MSGDKKAAFVKEAQGVNGLHMKANMCAAVNQELGSWVKNTMWLASTGSFKTLGDRLKKSPERLQSIKYDMALGAMMVEDSHTTKKKARAGHDSGPPKNPPEARVET